MEIQTFANLKNNLSYNALNNKGSYKLIISSSRVKTWPKSSINHLFDQRMHILCLIQLTPETLIRSSEEIDDPNKRAADCNR